jgi:O-antigen ligase
MLFVVAAAAILDYLLRPPTRRSRLLFDLPFLALATATIISAVFAFRPSYSLVPVFRIVVIYIAFRVMIKFGREIGVRKILRFYLGMVTLLSLYNLALFVSHAGQIRAFGPAHLGYETLSMTAMPMALAFALWAPTVRRRWLYLAACVLIGLGIISTQARGPLLTVMLSVPVLLFVSWRKARRESNPIAGRVAKLLLVFALVVIVAVALSTTLLAGSWERYEAFAASVYEPQGTIALRLTLWRMAIETFLENPLVGIGIGNFRAVHDLYPEMKLYELHRWVKGMSAHNVLLHYLAETGLLGAGSLLALAVMGWRNARRAIRERLNAADTQVACALFIGMFVFLLTLLYMRAWTWGQGGYILALLFGLLAAWQDRRIETPTG